MPLYTVHLGKLESTDFTAQQKFHSELASLHAITFGTDPIAVRVDFASGLRGGNNRHGGYGYVQKSKWTPGGSIISDYIVAQINFQGSLKEWQDYCQKIVRIYGQQGSLRSIYLQQVDMEFEVEDQKLPGKVVASSRVEGEVEEAKKGEAPPYKP